MRAELLNKINSPNTELLESSKKNIKEWIDANFLPEWALKTIEQLINKKNWEELNDRFYKQLEFGTGGMRGRTIGKINTEEETGTLSKNKTPEHAAIGSNCLNDINIVRATIGLFKYSESYLKNQKPKLVIAHDMRHFSRHFCELAASTWTQLGGDAYIFDGPRSTPQLSFSVRYLKATAGIVITASHNPSHDNGYKVYFEDGAQIVSPHAEGIIKCVNQTQLSETKNFFKKQIEKVNILNSKADQAYLNTAKSVLLEADLLKKHTPKVVFTPIHGTGQVAAIPLMKSLGVEVIPVKSQLEMDPEFSTVKSPNPENAEALTLAIELAEKTGSEIVLATDPDADRMGVAIKNKKGKMQLLNGNQIGSILAQYRITKLREKGILKENSSAALIKTFVTTNLQEKIAIKNNLKIINTLTGFKWIGEKIKIYEEILQKKLTESGIEFNYDNSNLKERAELLQKHSTFYVFGGEESYGTLATDLIRDKDANIAVILFCELAAELRKQNISFIDYLNQIYLEYGFYKEDLLTILHEGASGSKKIQNILESYRKSPPIKIGDFEIESIQDFGVDKILDADRKQIPKQDFFYIHLKNGYSFAVRGSGTEPKIKFYLFANEKISKASSLEIAEKKCRYPIKRTQKSYRTRR